MAKFSERTGLVPARKTIQTNELDARTRVRLWNAYYSEIYYPINDDIRLRSWNKLLWTEFLVRDILEFAWLKPQERSLLEEVSQIFHNYEWYEIFDFIEFVAQNFDYKGKDNFLQKCNDCLKLESTAYRVLSQQIVQVTSEEELTSLSEALSGNISSAHRSHLTKALDFLSNREKPDYSNSIKESISAVESLCKEIAGSKSATLSKALLIIDRKSKIHPALKNGLLRLYDYTSDAGGIRHAISDGDKEITYDDAKFMIVICSAFVNYLMVLKDGNS